MYLHYRNTCFRGSNLTKTKEKASLQFNHYEQHNVVLHVEEEKDRQRNIYIHCLMHWYKANLEGKNTTNRSYDLLWNIKTTKFRPTMQHTPSAKLYFLAKIMKLRLAMQHTPSAKSSSTLRCDFFELYVPCRLPYHGITSSLLFTKDVMLLTK